MIKVGIAEVKIYIGTEPRAEIAKRVLQYSIVKHTASAPEFIDLSGEDWKDYGDKGQGTGFSLLRWSIPERESYKGKAIYLDADMLLLTDIKELWETPVPGPFASKWGNEAPDKIESSVMLFNCEKSKDCLWPMDKILKYLEKDEGRKRYREVMKAEYLEEKPIQLSKWWNVMDKGCVLTSGKDFHHDKAKLLHYTNVRNQPWYDAKNPNRDIWEKYFIEAYKEGWIKKTDILNAISKFDKSNPRRPNGIDPYWRKIIK